MTEETDPKPQTMPEEHASVSDQNAEALDADNQNEGDGAEESEGSDGASRDPRRASFLDDLPDRAELRPLVEAFVDGNYAELRGLERELKKSTNDTELLAVARELVERTEPDPLSKKLLALSVVFFLFIVGWVYLHNAH